MPSIWFIIQIYNRFPRTYIHSHSTQSTNTIAIDFHVSNKNPNDINACKQQYMYRIHIRDFYSFICKKKTRKPFIHMPTVNSDNKELW